MPEPAPIPSTSPHISVPAMPPDEASTSTLMWTMTTLFEVLVISLGIIFAFFAITGSMVWLEPRILGTSRLYWWLVKTKLQYDGRTLHPMHHGGGGETYKGEVNKQGQRHGKGKCV